MVRRGAWPPRLGETSAPIDSRVLCRALFDVYLGENPISEDGKRSIIAGFPGLIG